MLKIRCLIILITIYSQTNYTSDDCKKRPHPTSPTNQIHLSPELRLPQIMSLPTPLASPELTPCPSSVSADTPGSSARRKRTSTLSEQFSPPLQDLAGLPEYDSSDEERTPRPLRTVTPLKLRAKSPSCIAIPDTSFSTAIDHRPLTPIQNPTLLDIFTELAINEFANPSHDKFVLEIGTDKTIANTGTNKYASATRKTFRIKCINSRLVTAIIASPEFKAAQTKYPDLEKFMKELPIVQTPPASPK